MPVRAGDGEPGTATIVTGTYTGDGSTSQAITGLGITPKYVKIWDRVATPGNMDYIYETTPEILDDDASAMSIINIDGTAYQFQDDKIIAFGVGSFTVDDDGSDAGPNSDGFSFNYIAIGVPT